MVKRLLETEYLVVSAGAMGMAFTDALIDHSDVHVTFVTAATRQAGIGRTPIRSSSSTRRPCSTASRRPCWVAARCSSAGRTLAFRNGPASRRFRRTTMTSCTAASWAPVESPSRGKRVPRRRFFPPCSVSGVGGDRAGQRSAPGCRRYVPGAADPRDDTPALCVADDADVAAINELAMLTAAPSSYVIVGPGKTATDGIVWLLANGVSPDRIVWVRPRDPWMLNRDVVQPDPLVAIGLAADTMSSAADAQSLEDLFLRLEAAGVMLRIDRGVVPTMAKTPTLGAWELDLLRTIEHVVRLGHVKHVTRREIVLDRGPVPMAPGSLVVHCAASGLQYPPPLPVWGHDKIRLQTIRAGFPCFCAALAGYVEATRDDDRERNRLCPPNTLPDSPASWARMQARGIVATATYGSEPDIAAWANGCALNPARVQPSQRDDPAVQAVAARLADSAERGLTRMAELAHEPLSSIDGR